MIIHPSPKELGFFFPAEFAKHHATWLSWPHKKESWPGKIDTIFPYYASFVAYVSTCEEVCILVSDKEMELFARSYIEDTNAVLSHIHFYHFPTNDAWCRDHGPAFLTHQTEKKKMIVKWDYNAWGNKYPPFDLDNQIPYHISRLLGIPLVAPHIVMEGGAIEVNGQGSLLTSTSCLLNKNRNPHLSKKDIELYLMHYYGVSQILWIEEGIVGDDTDGHIDDTVRFVDEHRVITMIEENRLDANYDILKKNYRQLQKMRLLNGELLEIIPIQMPSPVYYEGQRLPASYANFYICNDFVVVPTFQCDQDESALLSIQKCFPNRKVVGIYSTDIIWGLGSFHCLSQQEPI